MVDGTWRTLRPTSFAPPEVRDALSVVLFYAAEYAREGRIQEALRLRDAVSVLNDFVRFEAVT